MDLADFVIKDRSVVGKNGHLHALDADSKKLIRNICDWVSLQSMDREDTIETLMCFFDGVLYDLNREDLNGFFDAQEERDM